MNLIVLNKKRTVAPLLRLILIVMPLWVTSVRSQGPEEEETIVAPEAPSATLFSYQGQLSDGNGDPISNAAMPMTFKLYDVATGGTACWSENHTGVDVQDGLFHVLLGQITAIDSACLTNDAYLELVIDSETLSPRELLTSVAHAIEAETLMAGATTQGPLTLGGTLNMGVYGIDAGAPSGGENFSISNNYGNVRTKATGSLFFFIDSDNDSTDREFKVVKDSTHFGGSVKEIFKVVESGDIAAHGNLDMNGNNILDINSLTTSGNVGIGTTNPQDKLEVDGDIRIPSNRNGINNGNGRKILETGWTGALGDFTAINSGWDWNAGDEPMSVVAGASAIFFMKGHPTTHTPYETTLMKIQNNGNVEISGNLSVSGSCSLASMSDNSGEQVAYTSETCEAGSITSGAYIEANLQTPEEWRAGGNEDFSKGDLLCWGEERLELCETANDPLVQGVANGKGSPIVLGAEPIKVIGKVKKGDYLVASDVPGYAMATDRPTFGIVIAQALEDFEGERGLIKAMIRKM